MKIPGFVFGLGLFTLVLQVVTAEEDKEILFSVPEGARRVKLEIQEDGAWKAHKMIHLHGRSSDVRMKLPKGFEDKFRVGYSVEDPVDFSALMGRKAFRAEDAANQQTPGYYAMAGVTEDSAALATDTAERTASSTEIVESDIWKVEGNLLYFFNQYRGLQIIDIHDPFAPELVAYLRMPALGEQMYVLDDQSVVLLLQQPRYPQDLVPGGNTGRMVRSEVVVVDWSGGQAQVASRTLLPGRLMESRLMGRKLFAVTNVDYPYWWWGYSRGLWWEDSVFLLGSGLAEDAEVFSPSHLSTVDFTFPGEPVVVEERGLESRAREVSAGGSHFLVVRDSGDGWYKDVVDVFELDPVGSPKFVATVECGGRVPDKFKMRVSGGVLTVVNQAYGDQWSWQDRHTLVENFSLPTDGFGEAVLLDSIKLAPDETLHATRFDGEKLYVVTFRQVDPLFVVDLANPAHIVVSGELEIPGWSTYLIPRGDSLVSIGREGTRVAVSLFNVADPANPAILSRLYLGAEKGYSWSEANWDEKAVGYLAEEGIILVPYQGYANGEAVSAMHGIQIVGDSLESLGELSHEVQARRATMVSGNLVSISGEEMLVASFGDLSSSTEVLARHKLSWPVNQLYLAGGEFLLQEQRNNWYSYASPTKGYLRLTRQDSPDELVQELELPDGALVDSAWLPGQSVWVGLFKQPSDPSQEEDYYYYYWNQASSYFLVSVTVDPAGSLTLGETTDLGAGDSAQSYYDVGFFHKGPDWLGVWSVGRQTVPGTTLGAENFFSNSRFTALSLDVGGFTVLSDIWRDLGEQKYIWDYPSQQPPLFADGRWLYATKSTSAGIWLEVMDYLDPSEPALSASPAMPSGLQPLAAFNPSEDGATLLFSRSYGYYGPVAYNDALYASDAMIAPGWYGAPSYLIGYFDGAGLYLIEDTFRDFQSFQLGWDDSSFFLQEYQYYYYPYYDYVAEEPPQEPGPEPVIRYALGSDWKLEETGQWAFPGDHSQRFRVIGNHLYSQDSNFIQWTDIRETGAVPSWAVLPGGVQYSMNLDTATYHEGAGFWFPAGQYGVEFLPIPAVPGEGGSESKSYKSGKSTGTASTWQFLEEFEVLIVAEGLGDGPQISTGEDWAVLAKSAFLEGGQSLGSGWFRVEGFGDCYTDYYPWVYHSSLGWCYFYDSTASLDSFWMWRLANGDGWLWTAPEKFPWAYNAGTASWWYFLDGADGSLFRYDKASGEWVTD